MNIEASVRRLPPSIRRLIETEPSVLRRITQGDSLERILRSVDWASSWLQHADDTVVQMLKLIILRFAGIAFEPAALSRAAEEQGIATGAEVRVAAARLRRSGVLFAVRKSWGDRLLYVPTDMVAVWQSLLMPVEGGPLTEQESGEVRVDAYALRLPLALELFTAWHSVYLHPLTVTSKGTLQRPPVARMTANMRVTAEELAFLSLTYPGHEQVPAHAALAIDFGLCCGVLRKEDGAIRVSESGLQSWLTQPICTADARLHELALTRFSSADAGLHMAASAVHSLPPFQWYRAEQIVPICGDRQKIDDWLGLLQSFGWLEKGTCKGQSVFRKNCDLSTPAESEREDSGLFFVQPDGEIVVPPDVCLAHRWLLEQMAERVTIDALFVYRLTRTACEKACHAGYTLEAVTEFLERGSGEPLPESVGGALRDWFAQLGKVKLAQVTLLRTESAEVAERLRQNPELSALLTEQIGDKDFVVDASAVKALAAVLQKIGYPPSEANDRTFIARPDASSVAQGAAEFAAEEGWLYLGHLVTVYEPDQTFPRADDLFPGLSDIPAAWIRQPRAYHVSTRKELIQRAIRWQAPVRVGGNGESHTFIPKAVEEQGAEWSVSGQWKSEHPAASGQRQSVVVQPGDFAEMMILLPPLDEFESI
ncbi:hypothetical protein SD71_14315 [Cohnella kolymensis]|uniref:Helicase XPB/Ssl2 N-terminal domain-containing protein n=1 Tax=Cohnella kolymensis TaxID=1590652 RepID=A0ABR5A2K2_9BACL|nr:helicase-associated domain-containing protein [Cohnella kolymensis]KIL35226.1 hypothetical protein SD71_14315 [Cohnella kolymensis]